MSLLSTIGSASARAYGFTRSVVTTVTDAYFNFVTLLLNTTSVGGSNNNSFVDSSSNSNTITPNGNKTQGTFSPFSSPPGYWSAYFGGTGYYATFPQQSIPTNANTFTIEAWVYQIAAPVSSGAPSQPSLVSDGNPIGSGANWMFGVLAGLNLCFWWNDGATASCSSVGTVPLNTWTHIAVCVTEATSTTGTPSLYINGVKQTLTGTTTVGWRSVDQARTTIGQYANTASYINSYVSNLRIVTGAALYSTTFTPPTSPLGVAGTGTTVLLTLQNANAFKDSSSNNRTIIPTLASTQPFYPFATTTAYSTTTGGGSVFFDGTGDYLTVNDSSSLQFGTGPFTINLWVYRKTAGATDNLISKGPSGTTGFALTINTSNQFVYTDAITSITSTATVPSGAWTYLSVVRTSNAINQTSIYINGVFDKTGTSASSYTAGPNLYIGATRTASNTMTGTIACIEIKNIVTTPALPTAPPTSGANTALLMNFTNAGIYDASAKNSLETVGSAQVSDTQAKFGTTSMIFSGTGNYAQILNDSPNLQLGTGDFTIEGWFYLNTVGVAQSILSKGATTTTGWSVNITSANKLQFSYSSTSIIGTPGTTLALGSSAGWYYFAVVRSGSSASNLKLYLGSTTIPLATEATSGTASTDNFNQTNTMYVGANRSGAAVLSGYLDEIRITKGFARTITSVPTSAFPIQ
jgi:hypothetical protein